MGEHPTTYYYGTNSGLTTANHNLWEADEKSLYDPCPIGWRVPKIEEWSDIIANSSPNIYWNDTKYGSDFGTFAGGWYPASGFRNTFPNALTGIGIAGRYWSTLSMKTNNNAARVIHFAVNNFTTQISTIYSCGLPIRCAIE
jgi:uncharacterized protein (TIGR02145 family)